MALAHGQAIEELADLLRTWGVNWVSRVAPRAGRHGAGRPENSTRHAGVRLSQAPPKESRAGTCQVALHRT